MTFVLACDEYIYAFFANTLKMALDARYAVRLVGGVNPTSGNLTAAGGDLPLEVADEHWLHSASGGLPASATAGFRLVDGGWRRLEIAFAQVVSVPTATASGLEYNRFTFTLLDLGRAFERLCVSSALAFESAGSLDGAMAVFVSEGAKAAASDPAAWVLSAAGIQQLPAPVPATPLSAKSMWTSHVSGVDLRDPSGGMGGMSALSSLLPNRFTSAGRNTPAFEDAAEELYDIAAAANHDFDSFSEHKRARVICALVMRKRIAAHAEAVLQQYVSPAECFQFASLFRLSVDEAFQVYFVAGWRLGYASVGKLMGDKCDGSRAWVLVGHLLGDSASPASVSRLNGRVGELLPMLETAELRDASAEVRVAKMSRLLVTGKAGDKGDDDKSGKREDWAHALARPPVVALMSALEPLHVEPLVQYRVARALMNADAALGLQLLTGALSPPSTIKILSDMKAAFNVEAALQAFQRDLCISEGALRNEWFQCIHRDAVTNLVKGNWDVGEGGAQLNLWNGMVAPLIMMRKGEHFLEGITCPSPRDFFSSEKLLRLGGPVVAEWFAVLSMTGSAPGSVASVFSTLHELATRIEALPNEWAESRSSLMVLLQDAGADCFRDSGVAWRFMLCSSVRTATKPVSFADSTNAIHAHVGQIKEILTRVDHEVRMTQLRRRGQFSSAGSSAGSSIGSASTFSASATGAPSSRPLSATGSGMTDLYNGLESISMVGSESPSTRTGMQRSAALSGSVATSIPPATLEAEWGTLTSKLQRSARNGADGYWFGNIFGGAPPGHSIEDMCPGSLCPNARDAHKYCVRTPFQCTHPAPPFQLVVKVRSEGQGGYQGGGGKGDQGGYQGGGGKGYQGGYQGGGGKGKGGYGGGKGGQGGGHNNKRQGNGGGRGNNKRQNF